MDHFGMFDPFQRGIFQEFGFKSTLFGSSIVVRGFFFRVFTSFSLSFTIDFNVTVNLTRSELFEGSFWDV